jgi:hypothetical protein
VTRERVRAGRASRSKVAGTCTCSTCACESMGTSIGGRRVVVGRREVASREVTFSSEGMWLAPPEGMWRGSLRTSGSADRCRKEAGTSRGTSRGEEAGTSRGSASRWGARSAWPLAVACSGGLRWAFCGRSAPAFSTIAEATSSAPTTARVIIVVFLVSWAVSRRCSTTW